MGKYNGKNKSRGCIKMDDEEYKKDFPDWYEGLSGWTIISFPHRPYKENKPQHVFRKNPSKRVETGGLQFEDDWAGYFIRGDDCLNFMNLYRALEGTVKSIPEQYRNIFLPPLKFFAEHVYYMEQQTIGKYIKPDSGDIK